MLTKPEIPIDYLTVPTNERLIPTKPRRTASFIMQSNQPDERIASNLSLPSAGNSILKQSNTPRRRPSTTSHLSVHYSPVTTENNEQIEIIPSPIENDQEEPTSTNRYNLFKKSNYDGLNALFQNRNWSNPFLHGRYE
jgi:hypothetical protein